MTREDLSAAVVEELAAELTLGEHQVADTDELTGLPGSGSVQLLRVAARLERRFDIEFSDQGLFEAKTVGELTALVAEGLSVRGGA
ncbi:acyl carrier protein [Crossiella equi]|uniref:Acyl carrier protein n=1 Tax=Crossiella equi TaxID=130796 RepID=A0ABS5AS12_9PSEU|nr:phosphopantetheine-binding protein [Crossiella equi]MBP2479359.1 acyl carrier protein [Crossiella equi]